MKLFWFKITHCFVEWQDDNGQACVSMIPWFVFLKDKLMGINFTKYIVPWKIHFYHS